MNVNLNKDSLRRILQRMPEDTNKALVCIIIGQLYEESQPDSAIWFYNQANRISEKLDYKTGILK
jgi:hypothetical protein